ncbi:hypothetical protein FACS1894182_02030 [Bacteroidia bacterium]|nr:hypothetical protein FACS1894182_02030 [Bacteroidia bacterium]
MKRKITSTLVIAIFAFCLLQNTMVAQENSTIPLKNALMVELNFKPFGENVISFNQLQLKYKISDNWALRLGLAFDHNTMDLPGNDYDPSEEFQTNGNEKSTKFGVLPGIEYHFLKNSKISPFIGLELSFFNRSLESHYRDYTYDYSKNGYIPVNMDIDGAIRKMVSEYYQTSQGYYYYVTRTEYPERSYTSFGGNLLLGCDFYFMRNLYVGVEAGLGYNQFQYKKVTVDISNAVNLSILPSYKTTTLGFYYNSALRLGFWF